MGGERQRGWWTGAGNSEGCVSELARGTGGAPSLLESRTSQPPPPSWELVLSLPDINLTSLKIGLGNHIEFLQRIHAPPMAAALKLF